MTYAVIYSSKTGNTKQLADAIVNQLGKGNCVYQGMVQNAQINADILYIGFWTDKGTCDEAMKTFLNALHHKKIILFGTAGFGQEAAYFQQILENVKKEIPADCMIADGFMCQGKMALGVRQRYEGMLKKNPKDEKTKALIRNFDQALSHPNQDDLEHLSAFIADCQ